MIARPRGKLTAAYATSFEEFDPTFSVELVRILGGSILTPARFQNVGLGVGAFGRNCRRSLRDAGTARLDELAPALAVELVCGFCGLILRSALLPEARLRNRGMMDDADQRRGDRASSRDLHYCSYRKHMWFSVSQFDAAADVILAFLEPRVARRCGTGCLVRRSSSSASRWSFWSDQNPQSSSRKRSSSRDRRPTPKAIQAGKRSRLGRRAVSPRLLYKVTEHTQNGLIRIGG
jgi:hypothetical protein